MPTRPRHPKRAPVAAVVAVYMMCPYCGSGDVVGQKSGSLMITADEETIRCLDCDAIGSVAPTIFASKTTAPFVRSSN